MNGVDPFKLIERYWDTLPVPIDTIIDEIGLTINYKALDDNISGWIELQADGSYQIVVNANHASTRRRFTAAHELGHYIYHRDLLGNGVGDNRAYRSEGTGHMNAKIMPRHERQANTFAANVLMPRHVLAAMTDRTDAAKLARIFAVSPDAMRIRIGA